MAKKLYLYDRIDQVDPQAGNYHREGGLVVITDGYPNDAVPHGTGNFYEVTAGGVTEKKYGLPEATLTIDVADSVPNAVYVFPDAGCC